MKRLKVWFYDIPKYQYQEEEDTINAFLSKIDTNDIISIQMDLDDEGYWRIAVWYIGEIDEPTNPQ